MPTANRPFVIALEEHYSDAEVARQNPRPATPQAASNPGANMYARLQPLLLDISDGRIAEMDANGIDVQVLSHVPGPVQQINPEAAVEML